MGLNVSSQIYAKKMAEILEPLNGCKAIADDVLIFGRGSTKSEAQIDHDRNLTAFLERCRQFGIRLNKSKLKVNCDSVKFMGHILTQMV